MKQKKTVPNHIYLSMFLTPLFPPLTVVWLPFVLKNKELFLGKLETTIEKITKEEIRKDLAEDKTRTSNTQHTSQTQSLIPSVAPLQEPPNIPKRLAILFLLITLIAYFTYISL